MPLDNPIFGEGIYTPREAARLIGSTAQEIIRWTRGSGPKEPLWRGHYQFLDDTTEISFIDMIELRVVRALRLRGVSLQSIRYAIALAENQFGISRPLSTIQFKTDGAEILMDATEQDGELVSLSPKRPGQKAFARIIDQSVSGLEFDGDRVARWRPNSMPTVIIDPERAFGDPILDSIGISTHILFREVKRSHSISYVSRLYEIDAKLVRHAVKFEESLDKKSRSNAHQGSI
ncbi:MAG: hypothetical protein WD046_10300 [Paracoccaceae bacterium]